MTPEFLKFFLLAPFIILQAPTGTSLQSVRDELTQLQKSNGLSLILVDDIVQVMIPRGPVLAKQIKLPEGGTGGEISTDGTQVAFILSRGVGSHLAISRIDGANVREYDNIETASQYMCWSHDKSKLVLQGRTFEKAPDLESTLAAREHQAVPVLKIVDLYSGTAQQMAEGSVTPECWSPDDKQVVYEADRNVRVYDVVTKRSQTLSGGQHPSWSPDGTQIAFMRDDGYYSVSPSGTQPRRLFKKFQPRSGLFWSPDSRFVAYVSQSRFFEYGFALDVETYCLRIRRMADNAEWRVSPSNEQCAFQWVLNKDLLSSAALIDIRKK